MVDFNPSYAELFSRKNNNSDSGHSQNKPETVSIISIFGALGIVLIVIIIVSCCIFRIIYLSKRSKSHRRPTYNSSVYVVPVRNDIMPRVIEEPPPSYYSVVQLQERETNPTARF